MPRFKADSVQSDEILSRYIFDKNWYRSLDQSVMYTAFMPRSDDLHVSVFRTSGLGEPNVWSIGERVGQESHRTLRGRGDIVAVEVRKQNLDIDPDNHPPRHANIVGWPQEKHKRQEIAQVLASSATLRLRTPTNRI